MKPINEQLRNAIASALLQEVELPEGMFISITKVQTAPDLQHADVYVSILPDQQVGSGAAILKKQLGRISKYASQKVPLRKFPRLHVKIDDKERSANRIEELLDSLKD